MLDDIKSFQKLVEVVLVIIGFTCLIVDITIISYLIERLS